MPIKKRFSDYIKEKVQSEDNFYGVYELANSSNEIIYIGEGKIRTRLKAHLPYGQHPVRGAKKYRVEYTYSKRTCEQRERALQRDFRKKNGRLPSFNLQLGEIPNL
ncbi:DUF7508 domain-containing protein [Roseivirga pacifica]|uniref:DUF7508 domain-containing protein n=1 Tax=Roseivirga pacifica TaxID=1267423 RepID=UPI003BAA8A67